MGDSAEVVTDLVDGKEKKEEVNHSEGTGSFRKAKVICTAGVFIFTKSQFSQLFLLQNWRQITPPPHPGPSGSFSALPQRWRCLFMREEEGKGRSLRETSAQLTAILETWKQGHQTMERIIDFSS